MNFKNGYDHFTHFQQETTLKLDSSQSFLTQLQTIPFPETPPFIKRNRQQIDRAPPEKNAFRMSRKIFEEGTSPKGF